MSNWKKKVSTFYRIFTKVVAVFFILLFFHSLSLLPFKKSAQIVHYREYIYPEKYNEGKEYIGQDAGRISQGAQDLTEIEAVESSILTKAQKKLQSQGQDLKKNQTLIEAKEKLKQAEEECQVRKADYEKKVAEEKKITPKAIGSLSPVEEEIIRDCGQAWILKERANIHRQTELNKVREEVIQNIQNELTRAELSITELNIELTENREWVERSWYKSIGRDPIRFFFIQPCQAISKWTGIINIGLFWDLLLKVLLMRLLLNWISYPPRLDLFTTKPNEKSEPTDLASLEEEKKLVMQQWEGIKQTAFNVLMSVLLINFFSFHPYVIDRTKAFFGKSDKMILWLAFYVVVSLLSQFTTAMLYQKTSFRNYLKKNSWPFNIFIFFLICAFYYSRGFGDYLVALMSEVVNIFINLVKKLFQSNKPIVVKKEKFQWKRKWNYKNYKH